jgi:hypothetical protein
MWSSDPQKMFPRRCVLTLYELSTYLWLWNCYECIKREVFYGSLIKGLTDQIQNVRIIDFSRLSDSLFCLDIFLNHNLLASRSTSVQVNLCQKLLILNHLTHNMTTDCSLNYKFNTWKFKAQTWGELFRTEIVSGIQNNFCTQHVLPMFCKKKSFWQRFTCKVSRN